MVSIAPATTVPRRTSRYAVPVKTDWASVVRKTLLGTSMKG
jgi:hypothetical protein